MNIKVRNNGKDHCTAKIELGEMKLFIFALEDNLVITDTGQEGNRLAVMPRATNNTIEITVTNPFDNGR